MGINLTKEEFNVLERVLLSVWSGIASDAGDSDGSFGSEEVSEIVADQLSLSDFPREHRGLYHKWLKMTAEDQDEILAKVFSSV